MFILYLLSCNIKAKLHAHFYSMLIDQGPLGLPGRPGDPGEKGDTGKPGSSVSSLTFHIKLSLYPEKDQLKWSISLVLCVACSSVKQNLIVR